jgi:hypothetical protein
VTACSTRAYRKSSSRWSAGSGSSPDAEPPVGSNPARRTAGCLRCAPRASGCRPAFVPDAKSGLRRSHQGRQTGGIPIESELRPQSGWQFPARPTRRFAPESAVCARRNACCRSCAQRWPPAGPRTGGWPRWAPPASARESTPPRPPALPIGAGCCRTARCGSPPR